MDTVELVQPMSIREMARKRTEQGALNVATDPKFKGLDNRQRALVQIRFQNIENPATGDSLGELEFDYLGQHWHLIHNESYELPIAVIEHLNGLVVEEAQYEMDEATRMVMRIRTTYRQRFSCVPTKIAAPAGATTAPPAASPAKKG